MKSQSRSHNWQRTSSWKFYEWKVERTSRKFPLFEYCSTETLEKLARFMLVKHLVAVKGTTELTVDPPLCITNSKRFSFFLETETFQERKLLWQTKIICLMHLLICLRERERERERAREREKYRINFWN